MAHVGDIPVQGETAPADGGDVVRTVQVSLPEDADLELLAEFVTESREHLEGAEQALISLEENPEDADAVHKVFRAFHTVKGTSSVLDLPQMSTFAHEAESLLSRVRDGDMTCVAHAVNLALEALDALKSMLAALESLVSGAKSGPLAIELGDLVERLNAKAPPSEEASAGELPANAESGPTEEAGGSPKAHQGAETLRVRTERLDRLIELVGELVIAQTMVSRHELELIDGGRELAKNINHASKIVRELQDMSMSLRMVPLTGLYKKVRRAARDTALKRGKIVRLVARGEDTEIDRNMVDLVVDPLMHMVRNAIDHGIESPEERSKLGKQEQGTITLSASHESGSLVLMIEDDGRGLDRGRIRQRAVERGLLGASETLEDAAIAELVFSPGFSTANQVSAVSGRGVGMDVVRRNVEKLRGRVEMSSQPGRGTTVALRLPLTLALTDSMLVAVGRQHFVVPTHCIVESFRPETGAIRRIAGRGEVVALRDRVIPLFHLSRIFGIPQGKELAEEGLVLVLEHPDGEHALLVDDILGQQQVVAKPLGEVMGRIEGIGGAAILGDGHVGLILEPAEVAALGRRAHSSVGPCPELAFPESTSRDQQAMRRS